MLSRVAKEEQKEGRMEGVLFMTFTWPRKKVKKGTVSYIEKEFAFKCGAYCLPPFEREYRFASPRRWRFDFAWPEKKLAVECEGGIWTRGRHTRGTGFIQDLEKYNMAVLLGWRVLRFDVAKVQTGEAIEITMRALDGGITND